MTMKLEAYTKEYEVYKDEDSSLLSNLMESSDKDDT